ncbi:YigZ family protein, partial [Candidatus Bipolaricaulota bacterium]|nr:YigZ family protein [Candidatus Bipolaricaulota bacterium]
MIDSYRTLSAPATARITRKKSRFIAEAFPVASPEEADRELTSVRKRHHDASHHCHAYRVVDEAGFSSHSEDA